MNELIQNIQSQLAEVGAPAWLQQPAAWIAIASGLAVMLVLIRMLIKRTAENRIDTARDNRDTRGGVFGPLTEALAGQIPESEKEHREFGAMLKQAGMYSRTARASVYAYRFLLMTFPLFCAGLLAIFSPREQTWRIMIGGAVIAAALSIIPRLFIWYRRRVRLAQINGGLADMLDMLSMCLSGGMSISASLDHVSKNLAGYPALAEELQILRRQSDVGSLRIALADFANRMDTPEIRQVATLLARGDQLGTSMSGSLLDQADHFRTARKQLATLQANRMPVFLSFPLLFCFAPAVLIILMSPSMMQLSDFLNPENPANNPLANNQTLGPAALSESIRNLDQNIRPVVETPAEESPMPMPEE
ncbi:MAG: type II secretion system F family protein [Planctomycetaceae bacterium]|nr:type II secretion system F family protein [Planctomycetaceae bacterium]